MEISKLLIERLLSWPIAIVLICAVLRKPIIGMLNEIAAILKRSNRLSFKHGDTTLEAGSDTTPQQRDAEKSNELALGAGSPIEATRTEVSEKEIERARQNLRDFGKGLATIGMREEMIRAELVRLGYALPDGDLVDVLIRQVAGAILSLFRKDVQIDLR